VEGGRDGRRHVGETETETERDRQESLSLWSGRGVAWRSEKWVKEIGVG
jgi:hypothetical protein